ncbi:MAG TPA: hypothetical protein VHG32_25110 [Thermoanaerobaculia bacterium]|jgi:hypothetical protein|nr:hypothetical protein [Thermoanaerobaculia bacterium]
MGRKPGPPLISAGNAAPAERRHRSTISLAPRLRAQLAARGARTDKGGGPYSFTSQLARAVELFDSLLAKSDPRQTRDMPQGDYDLAIEALTDPLELGEFHIARLGDYLWERRAFRARAAELAIDPQEFRDRINAYPFAEKLHLVQAAQVRHASLGGR